MCLHDDERAFVFAKPMSFSDVCPVDVGEVFGLFHALQWFNNMQFDNVDFVVD